MLRIALAYILFLGPISFGFSQDLITDFTAADNTGCAPFTTTLTAQTRGDVTSWEWSIGDPGQTTTVAFPNAGVFDITLTASNGTETQTLTKTAFISVFNPPQVEIDFSTDNGCLPLTVNLSSNILSTDTPIEDWSWDFEDGVVAENSTPSITHVYQSPGVFNPTLVATDANGCLDIAIPNNSITVLSPQENNITSNNRNGCALPHSVNFNGSVSQGNIVTWMWDFGDGNTSNQQNPTHNYNSEGNFDVTLVTVSDQGCRDTLVRRRYIRISTAPLNFTLSHSNVCLHPEATTITCEDTSGNLSGQIWDMGDGTQKFGPSITHQYTSKGTYTITLSTGGNCANSASKTVEVQPEEYSLTSNINKVCYESDMVEISIAPAPQSVYWFRDTTLIDSTIDLAFKHKPCTADGIEVFSAIVSTPSGCTDTLRESIEIDILCIEIEFETGGCIPQKDFPSINLNSDCPVFDNQWVSAEFGNSPIGTFQHEIEVNQQGSFPVFYRFTDGNGVEIEYSVEAQGGIIPDHEISYDTSETVYCVGDAFDLDFVIEPAEGSLVFGKFEPVEERFRSDNILHQIFEDTTYSYSYYLSNFGCTDTIITEITDIFTSKGESARFFKEILNECDNPFLITNYNLAESHQIYHWDFGDGNTANTDSFVHIYADTGVYDVVVNALDTFNNCPYTERFKAVVQNPTITVDRMDSVFCNERPAIQLSTKVNGLLQSVCSDIHWFNNNVDTLQPCVENGLITSPTFSLNQFGNHVIRGVLKFPLIPITSSNPNNENCEIGIRHEFVNYETDLEINAPEDTCAGIALPLTYHFNTPNGIERRLWSVSNGSTNTTLDSLNVAFNNVDSAFIHLIVADSFGCIDTAEKSIFLHNPQIDFQASKTSLCKGDETQFTTITDDAIASYAWTFSDSTTSSVANPFKAFNEGGNYTVSLLATDSFGCTDVETKQNYITINAPIAEFAANKVNADCPPLTVIYENQSSSPFGIQSFEWILGDGSTSVLEQPERTYTVPGEYDISLSVVDFAGCRDTILKTDFITVEGPEATIDFNQLNSCAPVEVEFFVTSSKDVNQFVWELGNGDVKIGDRIIHTYPEAGEFVVQMIAEKSNNCNQKVPLDSIISVHDIEAAFEIDGGNSCFFEPVCVIDQTQSSAPISNYRWVQNNSDYNQPNPPCITYTSAGNYTNFLFVENDAGCMDSTSRSFSVFPNPEVTLDLSTDTICPEDFAIATATKKDNYQYKWLPEQYFHFNDSATTGFVPQSNAPLLLRVTNEFGCVKEIPFSIFVHEPQQVEIFGNLEVFLEESTILNAEAAITPTNYQWINPATEGSEIEVTPPLEGATYCVWATHPNGCDPDTACVTVTPFFESLLALPDAFTPNGDGNNDIFTYTTKGVDELLVFTIYNRWGEKIFSSQTIGEGWNGTNFNGDYLPQDVYGYWIKVVDLLGQTLERKGKITLIK